ncbi:hypothetical protein PR202_gb02401 [Eleusine coracana subsp. coracana]|uniref:RING-type domain-containing protein n=1 Tax=Eleusine coracana subsp. coracana TaxID=191504 RepID=A0AAV5DYV7_ELECO|nr:hypothetical protein PR202_gb02401 [Eleusine coracana subsp. coracana]
MDDPVPGGGVRTGHRDRRRLLLGGGGARRGVRVRGRVLRAVRRRGALAVDVRGGGARVWTSSADAASADWVLLHTKPCPRCRRPIERASGCIYIRCAPPCGHHFCFRCLRPVAGATPEGAPCFNGHDLLRRRGARVALDRFLRYQDLWAACRRKRRLAQSEARRIREEMTVKPRGDAKRAEIVAEAWEAVAEGRRVLGNACAHGIGLRGERELFDHQHGQADAVLDRMQQEAAVEAADLDKFVGDHRACNELAALTRVTWQCIEKLAKAVEEGMILPEMKAPASS